MEKFIESSADRHKSLSTKQVRQKYLSKILESTITNKQIEHLQ
jgi:hypothetical protein